MRAFVCNIVPKHLVVTCGAPQAPNNFCFNLIDGQLFNQVCSVVPMTYYNENIHSDKQIQYYQGDAHHGRIRRLLDSIWANCRCVWSLRSAESVWFYNICKAHLLTYILLRYLFLRKCYVILLDYTPESNRLSIAHYFPYLYRHAHGVISLSMRTSIANKNMQFKAGVVPVSKIRDFVPSAPHPLRVLFSGVIAPHTGFPMAFEVFKNLPDVEFYISGMGDVSAYDFAQYPNMHYMGYLEYEDYLKLYDKVDVCLSLRDPEFKENLNNFPSKILEYFCYNKVVISTIRYPEIEGLKYIASSYNVERLRQVIQELRFADIDEMRNNQDAIRESFSTDSWLQTIVHIEKNISNSID